MQDLKLNTLRTKIAEHLTALASLNDRGEIGSIGVVSITIDGEVHPALFGAGRTDELVEGLFELTALAQSISPDAEVTEVEYSTERPACDGQ